MSPDPVKTDRIRRLIDRSIEVMGEERFVHFIITPHSKLNDDPPLEAAKRSEPELQRALRILEELERGAKA